MDRRPRCSAPGPLRCVRRKLPRAGTSGQVWTPSEIHVSLPITRVVGRLLPNRRWTWLVLSLLVSGVAVAALVTLRDRAQEARAKEQTVRVYRAQLEQAIQDITPIGTYLAVANPTLLRRIGSEQTARTSKQLAAVHEVDPRGAERIKEILTGVLGALSDPTLTTDRLDDRAKLEGQSVEALAIANRIADREAARADHAEKVSLYGSIGALAFAILVIAALLTRERQQSLAHARRHSADMQHLADHDSLTGLRNRRRFDQDLDELSASTERGVVEIVVCDLDGFKAINDRLGHHAGDAVLITTAADLQSAVGSAGTVYRTGGDEFSVISAPGDRIGDRVREAIETDGRGSVGVAAWPVDDTDPHDVVRMADHRMYENKRAHAAARAAEQRAA